MIKRHSSRFPAFFILSLYLFASFALLANAQPALAESGCCQVLDDTLGNPTPWHFETMERAACATVNDPERPDRGWTLSRDRASFYSFDPGKTASYDGKDCMGRKTPTETPDSSTPKVKNPLDNPKLSVQIPGLTLSKSICDEKSCTTPWLGDYINGLYKYGISAIGILAVIAIMIGGILWVTSAGNDERIGDAKKWISGSIMGVVISLTAYMILNFVNPALTELSPIKIAYIDKINIPHELSLADTISNDVVSGTIKSKGQDCFLQTFGSSDAEVQKNLVPVTLFGKKVYVHKKAKEAFEKVNQQVGNQTNYKFHTIYGQVWRNNVNNPSKISTHAFGITVDINPEQNPNYKSSAKPCKSDLPAVVINAFKANGFRWGGDYRGRCDAMHFEWLELCKG